MKTIKYILIYFLIFLSFSFVSHAQNTDSLTILNKVTVDSIKIPLSSIDSLFPDSALYDEELGIFISKDAIEYEINYGARDSNYTLVDDKMIILYGATKMNYEENQLEGDSTTINFETKLATSFVKTERYKRPEQLPKFTSGKNTAAYEKVQFNFETKKAFIREVRTQEGEFFLLAGKSKYVADKDTTQGKGKFYNMNSLITTCNHSTPHFGVRALKLKMIPDKLAILGPSMIEIHGVPTPLILPFGFFPLIKGQSSGLIFPNSYDYDAQLGFGFREVGYYFPINDYIDMRVTGDIYTRGTHALRVNGNYTKRYKYRGNFSVGYTNTIRELQGERESAPSFNISISHNQDGKAHPYRNLGGNINISTNLYNSRTFNNSANVLNNTLRSAFNFNYRWPESPFKFSLGLDHNQNNVTREVNVTLPTANLNMNSINPFKRKNSSGEEKWYESIVLGYNASLRNFVKATDTTIFTNKIFENLQVGMDQNANISTNFRLLKYINVSPSAQVSNINFFRILEKNLQDTLKIDSTLLGQNSLGERVYRRDTTFGLINESYINTFAPYFNGNVALSANTQLFLTKQFKKGFVRGFRHVMKPGVSLVYSPDTEGPYSRYVDTDLREGFNTPMRYNPFVGGAYNASLGQEVFGVSWNINHIFEGKYRGKKDTIDKKFKLFENMYWSGNYNFAADSMKWSDVSISGTTQVFKGLSTFSFRGVATPYELNDRTQRLNQFVFQRTKFPVQLAEFNGSFNTGLTFTQIRDLFRRKKEEPATNNGNANQNSRTQPTQSRPRNQNETLGFLDLFNDFRINHNLTFSVRKIDGRDTLTMDVHSLQLYGSLRLTENWRLDLGNISYDFKSKQFVYPSLSFSRDLHCWNMRFAWFPDRGVYSFFIGVKSGAFNFLKYDYAQRNANAMFNPFGR